MYENKQQPYRQSLVYTPIGTDLLCTAEIKCDIKGDELNFAIISEDVIKEEDLMSIISSVQKNNFNKIKIDIAKDCNVLFKHGESVSKLYFDKEGKSITEVKPV